MFEGHLVLLLYVLPCLGVTLDDDPVGSATAVELRVVFLRWIANILPFSLAREVRF